MLKSILNALKIFIITFLFSNCVFLTNYASGASGASGGILSQSVISDTLDYITLSGGTLRGSVDTVRGSVDTVRSSGSTVDTVLSPKITIATAFGASFPTSVYSSEFNLGFSKSILLIYHTSDHFAIGANYNAIGFSPTSLTESNLQQYALFGLYYGRVYKNLGAFTKFSLLTQNLNGGASNFGQVNGFGVYYVLSDRFSPFLGFDISPVEALTKTYTMTLYLGMETPWK